MTTRKQQVVFWLHSMCGRLLVLALMLTIWLPGLAAAQPEITLRMIPDGQTIDLDAPPEKITLIARVNVEGVQFAWALDGPGSLDGDRASRKLAYRPPAGLAQDNAEVTITVTATDSLNETAQASVSLTLHDPTPAPAAASSPTPAAEASPASAAQIADLLNQGDAFFERTFYTEPAGKNAFSFYKQALALDPQNQHARERIRRIADQYKTWGENAAEQGKADDAQQYYERYLMIAGYLAEELGEQSIQAELANIRRLLGRDVPPPAPPTPMPEPVIAEVSPTPAEPTPDLIQRPGKLYAVLIGNSASPAAARPEFDYAARGAQELYDILTEPLYGGVPADQIMLLRGQDVTERSIKHAVGAWAGQAATAGDTVLVYYAGREAIENGDRYWPAADADPDDLYATALNDDDLLDMFGRLQVQHLVVFLDTCQMTPTPAEAEPIAAWELQAAAPGRVFITAAEETPACSEVSQDGVSGFTQALTDGVRGQADGNADGVIELGEVWAYLQQQAAGSPAPHSYGELSDELPLAFDVARLQEAQQQQAFEAKRVRLIEIYREGNISADKFKKALSVIENHERDQILEDFLAGKISAELFQETF